MNSPKQELGTAYLCPKCGQPLKEIRYPSDSMLNRDQWESQLPGDLFCTCHNNHKGKKPYAYFWKSDFGRPSSPPERPTPEPYRGRNGVNWDAELEYIKKLDAEKAPSAGESHPAGPTHQRVSLTEIIDAVWDAVGWRNCIHPFHEEAGALDWAEKAAAEILEMLFTEHNPELTARYKNQIVAALRSYVPAVTAPHGCQNCGCRFTDQNGLCTGCGAVKEAGGEKAKTQDWRDCSAKRCEDLTE